MLDNEKNIEEFSDESLHLDALAENNEYLGDAEDTAIDYDEPSEALDDGEALIDSTDNAPKESSLFERTVALIESGKIDLESGIVQAVGVTVNVSTDLEYVAGYKRIGIGSAGSGVAFNAEGFVGACNRVEGLNQCFKSFDGFGAEEVVVVNRSELR